MNRINQILIAALVLQILLSVVTRVGGGKTGVTAQSDLLPQFDPAAVTRVRVYNQEEADGKRAEKLVADLVKKDNAWVLANFHNYPGLPTRIDDLLKELKGLKVRGAMTDDPERRSQLEVADDRFNRKLVIDAGGKETTVYFGVGTSGQFPVRVGGSDDAYRVSGISETNLGGTVRAWIRMDYFEVQPDQIAAFSVFHPTAGTYEFERTADNGWKAQRNGAALTIPAGSSLDTSHIDNLLFQITSMRVHEPAADREIARPVTISVRLKPDQAMGATPGVAPPPTPPKPAGGEEYHIDVDTTPAAEGHIYAHRRGAPSVMLEAGALEGIVAFKPESLIRATPAEPPPGPPGPEGAPPPQLPEGFDE